MLENENKITTNKKNNTMIKINAGFNKKIPGILDYSSEGVHVTLEMELPDAFLNDKQALQGQIQSLVTEAREQVEAQLSEPLQPALQPLAPAPPTMQPQTSYATAQPLSAPRAASNKQLNYLLSLAKRAQDLGPNDICNKYQINSLQELNTHQASEMIEQLKTGAAA